MEIVNGIDLDIIGEGIDGVWKDYEPSGYENINGIWIAGESEDLFDVNKGTFTEASLLGSEAITDSDNQDFADGTINEWVVIRTGAAPAGTCAYDNTNLGYANEPDADDDQALLTSNADDTLYGGLPSTSMSLTANTFYKMTAIIAVPAANTLKDVEVAFYTDMAGVINGGADRQKTLAGNTWTTLTGYIYAAADVVGNIVVGFNGNPTDGDLLYYSDISVKPINISWVPYGTNQISIDTNALKITYVDNANGAYLILRDSWDLSADSIKDKQFKLTFQAKVNAGKSVDVLLLTYDGSAHIADTATITNDTYAQFELYYTSVGVSGGNYDFIRMGNMGAGEFIWLDSLVLKEVSRNDEIN